MKYFLILCSVFVLLSCEFPVVEEEIPPPALTLSSFSEVRGWINSNAVYMPDRANYGVTEYWATPDEFIIHGGGDCEDYVIFAMYYLYRLGYSVEFVGVKTFTGLNHALISVNGILYEAQGLFPVSQDYYLYEFCRFSLTECLSRCNINRSCVATNEQFGE